MNPSAPTRRARRTLALLATIIGGAASVATSKGTNTINAEAQGPDLEIADDSTPGAKEEFQVVVHIDGSSPAKGEADYMELVVTATIVPDSANQQGTLALTSYPGTMAKTASQARDLGYVSLERPRSVYVSPYIMLYPHCAPSCDVSTNFVWSIRGKGSAKVIWFVDAHVGWSDGDSFGVPPEKSRFTISIDRVP